MFLLFNSLFLLKYLLSGSMIPTPTPIVIRILIVIAGSNPDIGYDSDINIDTGWPVFGLELIWDGSRYSDSGWDTFWYTWYSTI